MVVTGSHIEYFAGISNKCHFHFIRHLSVCMWSLCTLRPGMVIGGVNSLPSLFETRYGVVLGFGFNTG